jgi:O-antigen/teichoic acid export membrane protein
MFIYMAGNVLGKLITTVFMLPLLTKTLSEWELGYYDLVLVVTNVIIPTAFFSVWDGVLRFSFDRPALAGKEKVFANGFLLFLLSYALTSVIAFLAGLVKSIDDLGFIVMIVTLQAGVNILQYYGRALKKNLVFAASGLIYAVLVVAFNYFFLFVSYMGVQGALTAYCLAMSGEFLFLICAIKITPAFRVGSASVQLMRRLIKFSFPLAINAVFYWFLTAVNRFFLPMEDNGNYSVAMRLANGLQIFTNVFTLAWQESAFESANEKGRSKTYSRGFNLYCRVLGCGLLVLLPLINLVFPFFVRGGGFKESKGIIPMFLFFTALSALSAFLGTLYSAEKRTVTVIWTTLLALGADLIVLLLFLKPLGLLAAPVATSAGFAVMLIVRLRLLRPGIKICVDFRFLALFAVFMVPVTLVYYKGETGLNLLMLLAVGGISLLLLKAIWLPVVKRILNR